MKNASSVNSEFWFSSGIHIANLRAIILYNNNVEKNVFHYALLCMLALACGLGGLGVLRSSSGSHEVRTKKLDEG